PAHRVAPVLGLYALDFRRGVVDGFFPADFAPGLRNIAAYHRLQDAVFVGGIAPGEAALHTGMAAVGLPILPGHHAHDFLALHFRLEGATHAAIGAGGDDRVFGLALLDDGLF